MAGGKMPYVIQNSIDDFPGPDEVKKLLKEAVEAANGGKPFNKTIKVKWEGEEIHVFARVTDKRATPFGLEFGKDHGHLLSEPTTSELKKVPGLTLNTQEVWLTIPLVLSK